MQILVPNIQAINICVTSPWASYQIRRIPGCAWAGNAGNVFPCRRFKRKPLVSDPSMHHSTCVTHVPWCMSGSLTCSNGENVPSIPCACAILRIWQEAHTIPNKICDNSETSRHMGISVIRMFKRYIEGLQNITFNKIWFSMFSDKKWFECEKQYIFTFSNVVTSHTSFLDCSQTLEPRVTNTNYCDRPVILAHVMASGLYKRLYQGTTIIINSQGAMYPRWYILSQLQLRIIYSYTHS